MIRAEVTNEDPKRDPALNLMRQRAERILESKRRADECYQEMLDDQDEKKMTSQQLMIQKGRSTRINS